MSLVLRQNQQSSDTEVQAFTFTVKLWIYILPTEITDFSVRKI